MSYGIYLLHVTAVTAAKHVLPSAFGSAPFVFMFAFAGSVAAGERLLCLVRTSFLALARPISTTQRTLRIGDPVISDRLRT